MIAAFSECTAYFEAEYQAFIAKTYYHNEPLASGCAYALTGQGKRIRPLLVLLSCEALGARWSSALLPACAIEMVHTYSLVHDDLPCMDNDDLRRGRATVHKKYDEATALLVGDTLFCDACGLLAGSLVKRWHSGERVELSAEQRLGMLQLLTRSSGSSGIVLGQVQDLLHTGNQARAVTQAEVVETYHKKTGSLFAAAAAMGALAAHATPEVVEGFRLFGGLLGTAFQIVDDLLDDSTLSGKTPGKDRRQNKKNLISVLPAGEARHLAETYTHDALAQLARCADSYALSRLRQFAETLLLRTR